MENIFTISNTRFIVYSDEETRVLITWNGSATFQWWSAPYENFYFQERATKTRYDVSSIHDAATFAEEWFTDELEIAK